MQDNHTAVNRVGFYAALLTAVITLVTFGVAMTAIPISGAFVPDGGVAYPYLDTLAQFPGDFYWMYLAIVMVIAYVALMAAIHASAAPDKRVFSQIGLSFAVITAVILLIDYSVQVSVVPVSLTSGETEGIPLLIQYNSHGLFIALEDLGYLLMSLSFLFVAPVFGGNRLESAVRWIFVISFCLVVISLVAVSASYGINRQDRLEVVILSIDWLVLIVNGILLGRVFRKRLKANQSLTAGLVG